MNSIITQISKSLSVGKRSLSARLFATVMATAALLLIFNLFPARAQAFTILEKPVFDAGCPVVTLIGDQADPGGQTTQSMTFRDNAISTTSGKACKSAGDVTVTVTAAQYASINKTATAAANAGAFTMEFNDKKFFAKFRGSVAPGTTVPSYLVLNGPAIVSAGSAFSVKADGSTVTVSAAFLGGGSSDIAPGWRQLSELPTTGGATDYETTITNNGPDILAHASVEIFVGDNDGILHDFSTDAGTVRATAENRIVWEGGLAANQTATVSVSVVYRTTGAKTLTSTVTSTANHDAHRENDTATAISVVGAGDFVQATLEPEIQTVFIGETATTTLTVTNTSQLVAAQNVIIPAHFSPAPGATLSAIAIPMPGGSCQPSADGFDCTPPGGEIPANGTASFTYLVTDTQAETVNQTVAVTSSNFLPVTKLAVIDFNPSAESADVSVTARSDATATQNQPFNFSVTVANGGPSDAASVESNMGFTPAGAVTITDVAVTSGNATCTATIDTLITCTTANLPAYQSYTVTGTAVAGAIAIPQVALTATVTSATSDPAPANNTATAVTTVVTQADVGVTVDAPPTVTVNANYTVTSTATNNGGTAATAVDHQLTITPPEAGGWVVDTACVAGIDTLIECAPCVANSDTIVECRPTPNAPNAPTCVAGADTLITCTTPVTTLAANGASQTMTISGRATAAGTVTSTATVSADVDSDPANNSATVTTTAVSQADVGVTVAAPTTVTAATTYYVTAQVTNNGGTPATAVNNKVSMAASGGPLSVDDNGGANCTADGDTLITCTTTYTSLAPGESQALIIAVHANNAGTVTSTATVTADVDSDPANNTATAVTTVTASADLSVTAKSDASAVQNKPFNFSYTVANGGPSDAASVESNMGFTPAGAVTITSVAVTSGNATCTANIDTLITCTTANIPAYQSYTVTGTAVLGAIAIPSVALTATVTSATSDPDANNNTATAVTTVTASADVKVTAFSDASATQNKPFNFSYTVANDGPSDAASVESNMGFTPAGAVTIENFAVTSGNATCTANIDTLITCTTANISAYQSYTVTGTAVVTADVPEVTATTTVTSTTSDPNANNNSATATTTVTAADTVPPTATIVSPQNGAFFILTPGLIVPLKVTAADNVAVTAVNFVITPAFSNPFTVAAVYNAATGLWESNWRPTLGRPHTIVAEASDAARNKGTSQPITVNIGLP